MISVKMGDAIEVRTTENDGIELSIAFGYGRVTVPLTKEQAVRLADVIGSVASHDIGAIITSHVQARYPM